VAVSAATQLSLRIPCWCDGATVTVTVTAAAAPPPPLAGGARAGAGARTAGAGEQRALAAAPCSFFNLSLPAGGAATVAFRNSIRTHTWDR
jgi:hypothetical protein